MPCGARRTHSRAPPRTSRGPNRGRGSRPRRDRPKRQPRRSRCPPRAARARSRAARRRAARLRRGRAVRVLIADDDAVLLHGLRVQLERWGYEPVACEDGEAARAVLRGPDPPPLAILDWSMPGADGITLCGEIRSTPGLDGIYVILLTAKATAQSYVGACPSRSDSSPSPAWRTPRRRPRHYSPSRSPVTPRSRSRSRRSIPTTR